MKTLITVEVFFGYLMNNIELELTWIYTYVVDKLKISKRIGRLKHETIRYVHREFKRKK